VQRYRKIVRHTQPAFSKFRNPRRPPSFTLLGQQTAAKERIHEIDEGDTFRPVG
jgi:hypothetical protein